MNSEHVETEGFPKELRAETLWMGSKPEELVANSVHKLLKVRLPGSKLLRVTCTHKPMSNSFLREKSDKKTAILTSVIVVYDLELKVQSADGEVQNVYARLGLNPTNLDNPDNIKVRYKFALKGDPDY